MTVRILEVGQTCLFKKGLPEQTTWLCPSPRTAKSPPGSPIPPRFGTAMIPALEHDLRAGAFGAIVYLPRSLPRAKPAAWQRWWWTRHPPAARDPARLVVRRFADAAPRLPLLILDVNDSIPVNPADVPLMARSAAVFKRELPADLSAMCLSPNRARHRSAASLPPDIFHPIGIGMGRWRIDAAPRRPVEKTSDVFFAGTVHRAPVRQEGLRHLRSLAREGIRVDIAHGLPLESFMARCAGAWLVWSPEGLGTDCFRHYEAPLCGSVPVISRAPIRRHRPLEEGTHALYYDPRGDDLCRVIRAALAERDRLTAMAAAAKEHVLRHHTHEALCRHMLETALPRESTEGAQATA